MSTAEPQQSAGPVTDDTGRCQLSAAPSLEDLPAPDVVVIGGSLIDEDPRRTGGPLAAPGPSISPN